MNDQIHLSVRVIIEGENFGFSKRKAHLRRPHRHRGGCPPRAGAELDRQGVGDVLQRLVERAFPLDDGLELDPIGALVFKVSYHRVRRRHERTVGGLGPPRVPAADRAACGRNQL